VPYSSNNISREAFEERHRDQLDFIKSGRQYTITPHEINIRYLREIIDFCKSKGMVVVFVNTPLHPDLISIYQQVIPQTDSIATAWAKETDVYYLNFSQTDFPVEGFKDHNHLNQFGAAVFTKQLNDTLKGLIKISKHYEK
jgi:collagenase-like PrtC family protease